MKIDMSKFKKLASNGKSTTLQHPDGHKIVIAHGPLSKKMRAELEKLPMMEGKALEEKVQAFADGGDVQPASSDAQSSSVQDNPAQIAQDAAAQAPQQQSAAAPPVINVNVGNQTPQAPQSIPSQVGSAVSNAASGAGNLVGQSLRDGIQGTMGAVGVLASPLVSAAHGFANGLNPPAPTPAAPAGIQPQAPTSQDMAAMPVPAQAPAMPQGNPAHDPANPMTGLGMQQRGINQEAAAMGALGKNEAATLTESALKKQQAWDTAQADMAKNLKERENLLNDIRNQHVDYNRYLGSMGTGQKIKTAISLILGGIGGAMTNQENPASKFLKDQIDRDIETQQAQMGQKETLLSANYKQYGNIRDAVDMTRSMMTDIATDHLKQAAAQAQDPLAKARAMREIGALQAAAAPQFQAFQIRRALQGLQNSGQASNVDPAQFVPSVVPKEHQAAVFKEIGNAQAATKNEKDMLAAFDKAAQENTVMRTGAGVLRTPPSIKAMDTLGLPMIHDAEGRVSEFEGDALHKIYPAPGDMDSTIQSKRQALIDFIQAKKQAPTAKGYGIDLQRFHGTTSDESAKLPAQQQRFVQWARQNPQDPRSGLILKKLGLNE